MFRPRSHIFTIKANASIFLFAAVWGMCLYPAVIRPYLYPKEYKKRQQMVQEGLHHDMPPGGMRKWTNPFEDRNKQEPLFIQRAREESEKTHH